MDFDIKLKKKIGSRELLLGLVVKKNVANLKFPSSQIHFTNRIEI